MTVHGDFSRGVIESFAGVLFQQGRVSLDTDGTAQTLITTAWQDTAARDAFGAGLAAVPVAEKDSFKLEAASFPPGGPVTVTVHPGRLWADGLLVRLEGTPPIVRRATYLQPPVQSPPVAESTIGAGVRDAVVLEVWREALNAFQVPENLLEPALGGPDTTERLHTPFAFRLYRLAEDETCESIIGHLDDDPSDKGKLTVDLQPTVELAGPCPVIQGGGYTGFEHNLYRIEIADAPGATRFKWSQYNGGLVGRAAFDAAALRATLTANLQAITSSALESFYLEALKLDPDLGHWHVVYGAEVTIDAEDRFVLPATPLTGTIPDGENVFIRLWNGIRPIADFPSGGTLNHLQDGILLGFDADAPGRYRAGDYWTFDVRAGEILNPTPLIDDQPPEGIRYHRVPLGVLNWNGTTNALSPADGTIEDCRVVFDPLTRITDCCTYQVGDGLHSHGDFASIQEAVDALPPEGGEICILPGVYTENVLIQGRRRVIISGCGRRSLVQSGEEVAAPVFHVRDSRDVSISALAIRAHNNGIGVLLQDVSFAERGGTPSGRLRGIALRDLHIVAAAAPAIQAQGALDVTIAGCLIEMLDVATTRPAVFFQGEDALIERNVIRVLVNRLQRGTGFEFDRRTGFAGEELRNAYEAYSQQTEEAVIAANLAFGGIQVGGLSERVRILENLIHGGVHNGITLGSLRFVSNEGDEGDDVVGGVTPPEDPCPPGDSTVPDPPVDPDGGGGGRWVSSGPMYDIYIEYNRILDMGLNGIGVVGFFNFRRDIGMVSVQGLTIHGNEIRRCLRRTVAPIPENMFNLMGYGGIALAHVEDLLIRENLIRDNGRDHLMPVCGVFLLFGEGVETDHNRIVNNGVQTVESPAGARPGARGGVFVTLALAPLEQVYSTTFRRQAGFEPTPALRLHDNVIAQPLGPALNLNAVGPVSVHANSLTSQGIVPRTQGGISFPGVTVTIRNLGLSEEETPSLGKAKYLYQGIGMAGAIVGSFGDPESAAVIVSPVLGLLKLGLPSGLVLFSDNQVLVDLSGRGKPVLQRRDTASRSRRAGVAEAAEGRAPAERATMAEWRPVDRPSLAAVNPTVLLGSCSIAILSLDDVAFHGNQCLTQAAGDNIVLLAQAILFASSLRVTDNRFKEGIADVLVSAVTLGILNTTSLNQATHCLIVRPKSNVWPGTFDQGNTVLAELTAPRACAKFDNLLGGFGQIPG